MTSTALTPAATAGSIRPTPPSATPRPPRRRRSRGQTWTLVSLIVISLFTVAPLLAVVILALSPADAPTIPHAIPEALTFDNIIRIFRVGEFPLWVWNSTVYSVVSVVVVLFTASMAAYALARKRFPGRNALLWSIVATLMVPMQATLIPTFILVAGAGGVNTLWGLILPTLANAQAVFLIRQFVADMPDELFDAARIDGAGEWRTFVSIVLPLIKPVLATLAIFVFLWHWNDLLWPLVVGQSDEARTLTVGLATLNTETVSTSNIMAAALISFVPCFVIFIFLQRHIVESITASGIKG
ncbi:MULTISPECIES: carbohydrate ABC transporter permease [unclassified Microbacterium]|uniref:carbohydrate ABC transporter permease n=1 Tax=unclassified Microbacterium TaxID=2609290 RepID=UPI0004938C90|nr:MULTISPECIES: carbohydrate ABC transporter permease [unclassified Microbacterium]PRB58284.1 carbohydrate ABC transporter permease [Microbacterium sp. MYb45]